MISFIKFPFFLYYKYFKNKTQRPLMETENSSRKIIKVN